MSLYIVDIHGDIEGDYEIVRKYEEQEPFINKPCVSSGVCEHDKNVVIDKIRAEIEQLLTYDIYTGESYLACEYKDDVLQVIDKYKAEYEVEE